MATSAATPTGTRTVYALQMGGRSIYCASAACVQALMGLGWKLCDQSQLMVLVKDLATGNSRPTHDPSDHF
jgi:hypothetical protein